MLRVLHPGTARSLANAQTNLDAVVKTAKAELMIKTRMTTVNAVAPPTDFVPCLNISRNGYPVGLSSAAVRSPAEKRTTISIARPSAPFSRMPAIIVQGTTVLALTVSSASCVVCISYRKSDKLGKENQHVQHYHSL